MKLFVLFSCLALSAAEGPSLLGMYEESLNTGMEWLTNMIKENVLNEDGSSFKPQINMMFSFAEPHICPAESNQCSPDENWLFGCKCRKSFRALGECKKKPCQLFRHLRDNGPASLNKFINAESYEDRYRVVSDYVVEPISRALCECPGMVGATVSCVKRYDGGVFDMFQLDRSKFDSVVSNVDWDAVKAVFNGFVKAGCGEKNGKDCVTELSNMWSLYGTFMDNSFKGEDVCLSVIRLEEEFGAYLMSIYSFDEETDTVKSFANRIIDAYVNMEREVMCEPSCAGEISDSFYSCCTKHALEVLSSKPMRKAYEKLFKNVWSFMVQSDSDSEGAPVPKLGSGFKKIMSVFDPASFCEDQTDVYKVKNEQCDALEA